MFTADSFGRVPPRGTADDSTSGGTRRVGVLVDAVNKSGNKWWAPNRWRYGPAPPTWTGATLLDDSGLQPQGFPVTVSQAFVRAATEMNAVVTSRTPGAAALPLISARHDLKSFYVHGKSCNWGAAGFICQMPPVSKAGAPGTAYNLGEHLHSVDLYRSLWTRLVQFGRRANTTVDRSTDKVFVPLAIPDALMQVYVQANPSTTSATADLIVGVASNADARKNKPADVAMEFAAVSETVATGKQWRLYHRQIWWQKPAIPASTTFTPYLSLNPAGSGFLLDGRDPDLSVDTTTNPVCFGALTAGSINPGSVSAAQFVVTILPSVLGASPGGQDSLPGNTFYPLRGAQNPYPPYPDGDARNPVAGDYDLFSVWPYIGGDRDGVIRLTERNTTDFVQEQPLGEVFRPLANRPYTVELTYSSGIYVEVIPGYKEITPLEDPVLGNINELVKLTVGVLNSYVDAGYRRAATAPPDGDRVAPAPNQAFHSDEGGRPGVTAVEYPVAVFLPDALTPPKATGQSLLIATPVDFVTMLENLRGHCELPLNLGWLLHLFRGLTATDLTGTATDADDTFPPQSLGERLASLLAGRRVTWSGNQVPDWLVTVGQRLGTIDRLSSDEPARTKVRWLLGALPLPTNPAPVPIWSTA
jgi:hypothetical protein